MKKTPEEFHNWIEKKIEIEFGIPGKDVKVGEFRRYYEGMNVGNEISKDERFMRVCLILNNNLGNGLILVAPITSKYHTRMEKYYAEINNYKKFGLKTPKIILNQVKLIDTKRFQSKLSKKRIAINFVDEVIEKYYLLISGNKKSQ